MVKASRKRHRSDTNAARKRDGATTDTKGRGMKGPVNGLMLYTYAYRRTNRERAREEYTVIGHGMRETGSSPLFEVYSIRFNGRLIAIETSRSAAEESARKLRNGTPGGSFENLSPDEKKTILSLLGAKDLEEVSETALNDLWERRADRPKWYGSELSPEEVLEEAENEGIEVKSDE